MKVIIVWLGSLVVSVSDPMTARSWVRSLTTALLSYNLGQVVHATARRCDAPVWGPCRLNIQIQIQNNNNNNNSNGISSNKMLRVISRINVETFITIIIVVLAYTGNSTKSLVL